MIKSKPDSAISLAVIAAIVGFAANLAQVSLFRFFMGWFYGTEMHLGIFLAIWLLGISLGGIVSGHKSFSPTFILNLILITTIFAFAALFCGHSLLPDPEGGFLPFQPVIIFMLACVFPVSFIVGMLLPVMINQRNESLGIYYSYEAIGGFCGGIFFSVLLGGTANSILCLLSLPVIILTALIIYKPGIIKAAVLLFLLVPLTHFQGPKLAKTIEKNYWQLINPTLKLEKNCETPYQKLQLASYYEQKSLYSNGMFSCSWPVTEAAEETVHSFVSALKNYDRILVIGAPPPDVVDEFLKYPGLSLSIVELDQTLIELFSYTKETTRKINIYNQDPRSFLNETQHKFDGIMIYPVSPVTLSGNRLFTIEALKSASNCLKPEGVLSLRVSGSENYLGSIKEQILLSTWQSLGSIFKDRFAFPGPTVTFFASQNQNVIPKDIKGYMNRFKERKIKTMTFYPMSFFNLLQPFRVKELTSWFNRPVEVKLNTDEHPASFIQQLRLWNIYSGASLNEVINWLQQINFKHLFAVLLIGTLIFAGILSLVKPATALSTSIGLGVSISGATGLLSEIILILLYQNSHGAAYLMSALFFGVYMLGLASGAWLFGHLEQTGAAFTRLKLVKFMQIVFTLLSVLFVDMTGFHSAASIAVAIFVIAFLDGIEFPVADSILKALGKRPSTSAGMLLFADNSGALVAGLLSGLWLLPAIGFKGSFYLLGTMLTANLAVLLIISKKQKQI
jgi:spermidine synthase